MCRPRPVSYYAGPFPRYDILELTWRLPKKKHAAAVGGLLWLNHTPARVPYHVPVMARTAWPRLTLGVFAAQDRFQLLLWRLVDAPAFKVAMYAIALAQAAFIGYAVAQFPADPRDLGFFPRGQLTFLAVYVAEVVLKVLALGWAEYVRVRWNLFDLGFTCAGVVLTVADAAAGTAYGPMILIFRIFRLLRILYVRQSFRVRG